MASIVLAAVGGAIGAGFGGSILGLSGAVIGRGIGSILGTIIDSRLAASLTPDQHAEGGRLGNLSIISSTEGAVVPRVYGRMRAGGNLIWATDFREVISTSRQGGSGKGSGGGVTTTTYSYFASFAVGICEGPISGIGRLWADGKPFDVPGAIYRVYTGTEDQLPDPHIVAKMGAGNVPAYRGTAYIVFEDLTLERFGNRLPQLSFEVFRPSTDPLAAEQLVQAVNLIPSAGEFVYATEPISRTVSGGASLSENVNSTEGRADFLVSLDQLENAAPNCKSVSLVVSWFGLDLRAGNCQIKPGVEFAVKVTTPKVWLVNGVNRASAQVISTVDGGPAYGGTPADFTVVQAIQELKSRGFRVTFYPFVLMDVPSGNVLPNPYSNNAATPGQPTYPWRGRITCSPAAGYTGTVDKTAAAGTQVSAFFGSASPANFAVSGTTVAWTGGTDWGLRRMILHYAHLCAAAGGVDAFLIGSELRGLTKTRSGAATYPAVTALQALATDCRGILGAGTKISYAADWSEYFGHQPADGSNDVFFHLDPLWAHANIDFVGIDNYMPMSDWRDGADHLDALAGARSIYDLDYLQSNIEGGEGFDWFYASDAARTAQTRTPITDAGGKPWIFRYKDLRNWWTRPHYNRPGGVETGTPTAWVAQSKPIRFTEAGAPAIDRSTNQPNVFVDPKSSESFYPYFSRGYPDDLIQRRYIEAIHPYWADPAHNPASGLYSGRMVQADEIAIWTWDARPFPAFPARSDVWKDIVNWQLGHWLTGRLGAYGLAELVRELCLRGGMDLALVETSPLAATVPGYGVSGLESARASIEPLARFYGFDAVESEGILRFIPRGGYPIADISADELVVTQAREAEDLTLTRGQETELPLALKWRAIAPDEDFGGLTVEARRITVDTARIRSEQFGIVYSAALAARNAQRALFEEWIGREEASFTLPPSRLALDPTDTVRLAHDGRLPEYALTRISDGENRRVEARRMDPVIYDLPPGPDRAPAVTTPLVYGPPLATFLDLPQLDEEIADWRPYVAVCAQPWYGGANVWRSAMLDGFALVDQVARPAIFGTLAFGFYAGPTWRFDNGNELWVDLTSGTFASVTDDQLFAGENTLAIESVAKRWEILQFGTATLISPGRWRLAHLLRGQRGTEDAMGNPTAAGARVIVLDGAVTPVSIAKSDVGMPWNWRVGPASSPAADGLNVAVAFTPTGRGLRPFSPTQLNRAALGGGDQLLTWTRRTRDAAGDSWVLLEVPLGEASEAYDLEVLNGAVVARTVLGLTAPSFTYTAAMQTTDFGGPVATVRFRVYQLGELGRGSTGEALV